MDENWLEMNESGVTVMGTQIADWRTSEERAIDNEITRVRAELRQRLVDTRGPWCERCLWESDPEGELRLVLGTELHEVVLKRNDVPKRFQVERGVFTEENCCLLCHECHSEHGHSREFTAAFLRVRQVEEGKT